MTQGEFFHLSSGCHGAWSSKGKVSKLILSLTIKSYKTFLECVITHQYVKMTPPYSKKMCSLGVLRFMLAALASWNSFLVLFPFSWCNSHFIHSLVNQGWDPSHQPSYTAQVSVSLLWSAEQQWSLRSVRFGVADGRKATVSLHRS